jgi:hypothetical protein
MSKKTDTQKLNLSEDAQNEANDLMTAAAEQFKQDLPDLLRTNPDKWVAYCGEEQLGFASSKSELLQQCLEKGYHYAELYVRKIQPDIATARETW